MLWMLVMARKSEGKGSTREERERAPSLWMKTRENQLGGGGGGDGGRRGVGWWWSSEGRRVVVGAA